MFTRKQVRAGCNSNRKLGRVQPIGTADSGVDNNRNTYPAVE